jgi:hypothetical protein
MVFWKLTPCTLVERYKRFGRIYHLLLQIHLLRERRCYSSFNNTSLCTVSGRKTKPKYVLTQLNSVYFIELQVSTHLRSSSGSKLVFITYLARTYTVRVIVYLHNIYIPSIRFKTNCEPEDDLRWVETCRSTKENRT